MRKYRGKRVDNGEWVYGYLIGTDVIVGEIVEFNDECFNKLHNTEFWYKVDPKTVGQSTGLKDKNGKEIYERDILDVDGTPWLVEPIGTEERDGGKFGLCASPYGSGEAHFIDKSILEGKVIGNDHDNPELLEV